ncbi:unnamed protein product [Schistosoma margrebowiei]|uniref:Uncharacterized protein n=2 Tax=Schistosoma margrebowiei TaxID=48269 RepID=A0A183MMF0_9TREM|nr:unnamed protein product [Schistosoma margrebowiei]
MVVGGSQQETLDPGFVLLGTRQQGVPVILRELVLPGGFDLVSPSFTVRDVTTELSEPPTYLIHIYDKDDLNCTGSLQKESFNSFQKQRKKHERKIVFYRELTSAKSKSKN